ncbi:Eco57I restriction-modification methylase domain-containing protein [Actinokineospora diospyrosa]|uniref:site-specific DNA-methyltransferase (adenine-specific) n=1 Tax=Actinokineospora diospyrosa TaxID=103728 RepID=A0ABT1IB57_9PSEU|nr:Eco57I restriction-modification methylase domain-containing protein [Actinokineospora diospyrosa]MCP2269873.1 TaqI-like C-terminal specificity domain-containing protein [Actinokineospora diospyrosa]
MVTSELFALDSLDLPEEMRQAVEHGEVFTRRWVVDVILDLVGYTAEKRLSDMVIVEPACGGGAFVEAIVERLSESCRTYGVPLSEAHQAIRASDLLDHNVKLTRDRAREQLLAGGWGDAEVDAAVRNWVFQSDYLLRQPEGDSADFVVGNPPYIRLEDVPAVRSRAYRRACPTMGGRADIYVGFYEVGLRNLKPGGRLGYICADRWMRNQYGRELRRMVAESYSVEMVLTMHDVDAFDEAVTAYPAITIIRNGQQSNAIAADATRDFDAPEAKKLLHWVSGRGNRVRTASYHAARLPHWFKDGDSWPAASPARLAMLEELAGRFPLLEDKATGTRVGIGIATGADKVFVVDGNGQTGVERDRLLPLAMVRDTRSGELRWGGSCLVNPWSCAGELVNLADYPGLARYYESHADVLRNRYVAAKQPAKWYKTIDKVDHSLIGRPKLLLPDMKMTIHPVLDEGGLYPHHNLYFVVSNVWDMKVLGGLLLSEVAEAFVSAYAVKMRGGTLRFQAQYLRKIRIPAADAISDEDKVALSDAFVERDVRAATVAAMRAYGIAEIPE